MKRFELALTIGLFVSILFTSFTAFAKDCESIRAQVVRLHILANSDSETDQRLKLQVRDAVLAGTEDLFSTPGSKQEAEAAALAHLSEIEAIAAAELHRQGSSYPVSARLVNLYFDTRVYENFTLPAGRYDAIQLEIGEGAGKNWWCVMFPPLCVPAAQEHSPLPLEEQIRALGQSSVYTPAFAVVEAIEAFEEWAEQRIVD